MARESDEALIRRAKAGEEPAFFALFERYKGVVHRFAKRMLGDDGHAADVVQETFEYFFRKIPEYRHESKITTLLLKAARNRALNVLEKGRRRRSVPLGEGAEPVDGRASDPGEEAAGRDLASRARAVLQDLDPMYREVIALKVLKGLSYDDIAAIIGVPAGTVKSRLHNGLERLRKKMEFR